uniref:Uncharacterized protein n=1 Tax=viral metagenome TaxID=1070528 RepID=A0A6M3Y246_9ZZZZ
MSAWELDTNADGEDDVLIAEPGETADDLWGDVEHHHEAPREALEARGWELRRVRRRELGVSVAEIEDSDR